MGITAEQAIAQLNLIDPNAQDALQQLEALIAQIDISSSGTTTVLYSGPANGYASSDYSGVLKNDPSIRIIDKTEIAAFLSFNDQDAGNQDLRDWLAAHFGNDPATDFSGSANQYWYGTPSNPGLWDDASKRFIEATVGEVRTITPNAPLDGVFSRTELQALLDNPNITTIDGIDIVQCEKSLWLDAA